MSGHKRVKDISYDDDGYDEYEEEGYEEQQAGAAPDPVERGRWTICDNCTNMLTPF